MKMFSPFQLPNELLLSTLFAQFSCREPQIRALTILLSPQSPSPKNIVLYGHTATGKSAITKAVLAALCAPSEFLTNGDTNHNIDTNDQLQYAVVKSIECITGRHLLETTVSEVAKAVEWPGRIDKCENLAQLVVQIGKLLDQRHGSRMDIDGEHSKRFVLVFDGIDTQRDAPPTLLPALAKLGDIIPNLTTVFIVTAPRPHLLSTGGAPYIHFPSYTKAEALKILALDPPSIYEEHLSLEMDDEEQEKTQKQTKEIWTRFCSAIWDTLSKHSGRDILSFRTVCDRLWPLFTEPLQDGSYTTKDFHRLLVAKRSLLQDESILTPSILSMSASTVPQSSKPLSKPPNITIAAQLPHTTRLLLIASYLSSYTPARHDPLLFSKSHAPPGTPKKHRRHKFAAGGASSATTTTTKKSNGIGNEVFKPRTRKINRKLLGPQAFVLERMLAIFQALRLNAETGHGRLAWRNTGASADLLMAFATLASLRLVVKTSNAADALDASTKWKVNVGWDVVRGLGRSVGVEVEDFVID